MNINKIILIFSFLISLWSCSIDDRNPNPQISTNIEQSKNNGVFVRKLFCLDSVLKSDYFSTLKIKECWIEKIWFYESKGKIRTNNNLQLIISDSTNTMSGYLVNWFAKKDSIVGNFGSGNLAFNINQDETEFKIIIYTYENKSILDTLIVK